MKNIFFSGNRSNENQEFFSLKPRLKVKILFVVKFSSILLLIKFKKTGSGEVFTKISYSILVLSLKKMIFYQYLF